MRGATQLPDTGQLARPSSVCSVLALAVCTCLSALPLADLLAAAGLLLLACGFMPSSGSLLPRSGPCIMGVLGSAPGLTKLERATSCMRELGCSATACLVSWHTLHSIVRAHGYMGGVSMYVHRSGGDAQGSLEVPTRPQWVLARIASAVAVWKTALQVRAAGQ